MYRRGNVRHIIIWFGNCSRIKLFSKILMRRKIRTHIHMHTLWNWIFWGSSSANLIDCLLYVILNFNRSCIAPVRTQRNIKIQYIFYFRFIRYCLQINKYDFFFEYSQLDVCDLQFVELISKIQILHFTT